MVKKYEASFLITPELSQEDLEKEVAGIEKVIVEGGAVIAHKELWAKRLLAYPIRKKTEGVYAIFYFESDPAEVKKMSDTLRIKESILRFIVISRKKLPQPPAAPAPQADPAQVQETEDVKPDAQ